MQDELEERVAQAAYIAHHKTGPWEDALDEPNMGRGGYKTEVARWHSIARAIIPIVQADQRKRFNELVAKNAALEVAYEELLAQHRAAIRNQGQTDGR